MRVRQRINALGIGIFLSLPHNIHLSGRDLAIFCGISARSIGRFEQAGVLERERNGWFDLQRSVQRLLTHLLIRERWAFQQLRRHRIFNEHWGDVFEANRHR